MQITDPKVPTRIHEDNTACIALVTGMKTPGRTRHLSRRIGYIRDLIESRQIEIVQCPTQEMKADPLTKPIGPHDLQRKLQSILSSPVLTMTASIGITSEDLVPDDVPLETKDSDQTKEPEQRHAPVTHSIQGECREEGHAAYLTSCPAVRSPPRELSRDKKLPVSSGT